MVGLMGKERSRWVKAMIIANNNIVLTQTAKHGILDEISLVRDCLCWCGFGADVGGLVRMGVTFYIKGVVATTPTFQKINIRPMGVAWKEFAQKSKCNPNNLTLTLTTSLWALSDRSHDKY